MNLFRSLRLPMACLAVGVLTVGLASYVRPASSRKDAKEPAKPAATRHPAPAPPDFGDSFGDGTPNFLRLGTASDQEAFRRWFVIIAEVQALRPKGDIPREINDCAALLRYSYRNALREHDKAWGAETKIVPPAALPKVEKYHYPATPLGASLFRIHAGTFLPDDIKAEAFAEFADAKTLKTLNTYFISRDIRAARPGDLLFYRQLEQDTPFHSMVFVGKSEWTPEYGRGSANEFVVYHTGPVGNEPGEMRRMLLSDLMDHPSPRWRPVPGNSNFLGVYRWNILREMN